MIALTITGMTCGHCEASVRKALEGVEGVNSVLEVDRAQNRAVVDGAPEVDALIKAIAEEGFEASLAQ